ncbi:MAG TPA: glycosyltransferase family 2 protein [Candidatus Peribacteraceae bacterium]|nr:glycosyltransferase family 2 protein [Candidatus Peribacteraceae bacterium]
MSSVSIVVPAFNEEDAISGLLASIHALHLDAEIVIVDDASTDRTAEIAMQHGAHVVRHPMNCGYGKSVKDGVAAAAHDTIIVTDADGTYPVDRIPELLDIYNRGFDMVVGARQGKAYRGTFLKMPARYVFKFLVEFTTGRHIPDINSGMRIFSKKTVEKYFPDICNGFSFTTTITLIYLLTGKMVTYVQIPYSKRIGKSKVKIIRDSLRTLQYITECIVRYNPLKLFLLFAILSFLIGLIGLIFSPLLFFQGLFFAVLIFAVGCIAETMRRPQQ